MAITRRQVIFGGIVAALAALKDSTAPLAKRLLSGSGSARQAAASPQQSAATQAASQQTSPTQPAQPSLMYSQDQNFDSRLDTLFPGLSQDKRFAKLRPFSAILVNTATHPIYGYGLRWRATSKSGVKESYHRNFFRNSSLRLRKRQVTGQVPLLAPGEAAVITPLFFWRATTDAGTPSQIKLTKGLWLKYKSVDVRAHGFIVRHAKTSDLKISMDARIYAAKVRGKRPKLVATVYRNRRNGEHDQAFSFLTHCIGNDGALDQELLQAKIASATAYFRELAQSGQHRPYYLARARFAQQVKRCLAVYGIAQVQQVLETVNGVGQTTLYGTNPKQA